MPRRYTYQDVKEIVEDTGYELISTREEIENEKGFVITRKKITIKCPEEHKYEVLLKEFIKGVRCRKCSLIDNGKNKRLSYEDVKNYIESFNYILVSKEYVNSKGKILIKCDKGHIFKTTWNSFKKGVRCNYCSNKHKYNYQEVKNYIESFGYELESKEYINNTTKLLVVCPKAHKYKVTFSDFKNGEKRCPICNESKGETKIFNLLNDFNIKFEREYRFNKCKNIKPLPFDFYLNDYNCCIEYDGKQHYLYNCFKKDDLLDLMNSKYRDNIKTKYCKDNNIKLIRIPYWDFDNIEEIIIKELNLNNKE